MLEKTSNFKKPITNQNQKETSSWQWQDLETRSPKDIKAKWKNSEECSTKIVLSQQNVTPKSLSKTKTVNFLSLTGTLKLIKVLICYKFRTQSQQSLWVRHKVAWKQVIWWGEKKERRKKRWVQKGRWFYLWMPSTS